MFDLATRLGAACLALTALASPLAASTPTPVGDWELASGESRFQITTCGDNVLCAKLTWLREDVKAHADLSSYLNDYVMQGAVPSGVNTWSGTVSYNGGTYSGNLTLVDADTLRLSGCMGIFCKSMELERI
ncbi:DUF2147 domain-containing protein [Pelagibacterium sp. 26DY04]|uniref:DUF2147 domain-containing protein n=1 Tax=Pelagibacterium sp. 26DY04 TaxID=2967130 RepID=UPI002814D607|nr:DUF2147 domain-containing protein [Pelagibacterium sp. 26DY04]WMT88806.1 DUF2147 domain-containing protein [Pelagibacterium sp. 26DY04]